MNWQVCFWGNIEWFSIAEYPDYESAKKLADECQNRCRTRLHWKVILKKDTQ